MALCVFYLYTSVCDKKRFVRVRQGSSSLSSPSVVGKKEKGQTKILRLSHLFGGDLEKSLNQALKGEKKQYFNFTHTF